MRRICIALLLACALRPCAAEPAVDTAPSIVNVIGTGGFSCGQFIEYQKINNPAQMDLIVQWVWGFITAYNFRSNFGTQWRRLSSVNPPDNPTILLFLETYCRSHPTDTLVDGTFALLQTLGAPVVWKNRKP